MSRSGRTSVLVVDDENGLRMTLAANLDLEGFDVVEASGVEQALAHLATTTFDVVLSDIRMPGRDGVELLHEANRLTPGIVFVLMTAYSEERLFADALKDGTYTILQKPFDIADVVATLTRAASRRTVLVVDDIAQQASSIADLLCAHGHRARAEISPVEALAAAARGEIDVALVDLLMPEMDGAELMAGMKAADRTVAMIAVTGADAGDALLRATRIGAIACVRKPLDVESLLVVLAKARAVGACPL